MLYTCSYNIYIKFRDDKRPKIPKKWTKMKPKGGQKYKILDKIVYNSPSAITSPICNTSW